MKYLKRYVSFASPLFIILIIVIACSKDNYDPPRTNFEGALLYEGDSIRVGDDQVRMELWQFGFGKEAPIDLSVAQNGTYSAKLFNGKYHLTVPSGNGPFLRVTNDDMISDTITFDLKDDKVIDLEVLPYYMLRDVDIHVSHNKAESNFTVERVVTNEEESKSIEDIALYLGKTRFVDRRTNISVESLDGDNIDFEGNLAEALTLTTDIPDELEPKQDYIFARIGLKIDGVEDRIFSDLFKLNIE